MSALHKEIEYGIFARPAALTGKIDVCGKM